MRRIRPLLPFLGLVVMKLRSDQKQAVDAIFDAWQKFKSVLVVLPTGCGKTVVFASVIRRLMTAEVKAKGVGEQWKVHFSQAARTPLLHSVLDFGRVHGGYDGDAVLVEGSSPLLRITTRRASTRRIF